MQSVPIVIAGKQFYDCTPVLAGLPNSTIPRSRTDGLALHHVGAQTPLYFATREAEENYIRSLAQYDTNAWGKPSYHGYTFPSGAVYVVGLGLMNQPAVAWENDHLESMLMVGLFSTMEVPNGIVGGVANWVLAKWKQHRFMALKGHRDWVNLLLHPSWATECPGDKGVAAIPKILAVVEALARCP